MILYLSGFALLFLFLGGWMLISGKIPVGKWPFNVKFETIENTWIRIAGLAFIVGGISYFLFEATIFMIISLLLGIIFLAGAIVKAISNAE
jgi:hypothetical protein